MESSSPHLENDQTYEQEKTESEENEVVKQLIKLKINKNAQMIRKFYDGKTKPIRIAGNAKVYLEPITIKNCMQFKKINDAVCNYIFNEKLYFIASRSQEFARLAYYNDVAVGGLLIMPIKEGDGTFFLNLGVLEPYQQCGIGTIILEYALRVAQILTPIKAYHLQLQGSNERAIKFYEKHGFVKGKDIIENFYTDEPKDALLYIKQFRE
ncbi:Protein CBG11814 [Caenorhabditis briggsae]|uniref:N-terminal methionine N(alpha)-acetyltransferase NatE n=2 Tax=Caenorhabditis briggsae TaxID=6238 RepID=A0AAE9FG78_CAEBR|nr:Protein CBG11814 [Caenorhabditis briggsae]ULT81462.1 hypothetical protein L3Y34_011407 [Caenorhabditis briggsae]UMM40780.1 hypothetical protein L5515_017295 [Caenorhabditis briggsae]CAP30908.2 Protein CBG11814 [Caenorhabditis briggsae]